MYPRVEYEMSEEDLAELLRACRSTPAIKIGRYTAPGAEERANAAWRSLGKRLGFDSETVRPVDGKGSRFFSAVPSETEDQREERLSREREELRTSRMQMLREEIEELASELRRLESEANT